MERLIREALNKSVLLLQAWEKPSNFGGSGWHELETSDHAGAHASCAALELITHPLFPLCDGERYRMAENVVVGFLQKLYSGSTPQAQEAKQSTVKIANLLSAYASVGRNHQLADIFQAIVPSARELAVSLVGKRCGLEWGHWLTHVTAEPRHLPTATVINALFRFGQVDAQTQELIGPLISSFFVEAIDKFAFPMARPNIQPHVLELWQRLPLLHTIATIDAPPAIPPGIFAKVFNAYLEQDVFTWSLTCTEDFQKFDDRLRPAGTDYVSFNTTACLVRALIRAVKTRKTELAFFDWATPHLATWARQITENSFPQPKRFSLFHQTLSCLLAALELQSERHNALPIYLPMYVNPTVFRDRGFETKPSQGFLITPFDLKPYGLEREHVEAFISSACQKYLGGAKKLTLIPGDHNYTGPGIMDRIWQHINESGFVIAVCIGANPNVYYEIGVAHTLGKPVLVLGREGSAEDIRFDLKGIRYENVSDFTSMKEISEKVHPFLGEALRM